MVSNLTEQTELRPLPYTAGIVAASKPDGYTLFGSSQSSIIVIALTQKDLGYTTESFAPIVCLVETPALLVV